MERLFYSIILIASFFGFAVAYLIWKKKREEKPIVCPFKFKCDPVVRSEYSSFFGIPLEYLGMLYYAVIFLSYLFFFIFPEITLHRYLVLGVIIATAFAFFFSIYLTGIQALVLRQWCSWCLISAGFCTVIFLSVVQASVMDMIPFLATHRSILVLIHMVGLTLGFGGALITDVFFVKFLKDGRISEDESGTLGTLSQIIWLGLGILVVSGGLLFLSDSERLSESAKFLAKMVVVGVIIANGFLLNIIITPRLRRIPFGELLTAVDRGMRNFRRLAFALGAVSAVSWWSAFTLGMLRSLPLPFHLIIGIYLTVLIFAVGASQVLENFIHKSKTYQAQ